MTYLERFDAADRVPPWYRQIVWALWFVSVVFAFLIGFLVGVWTSIT